MAYRILPDETVETAVQRIAHEQIDNAVDEIDDGDLDEHETVHQVRKRCKKIRGLIRLVRPAFDRYSQENAWFRDAARTLSDVRDASTLLECFDALMERYEDEVEGSAFDPVRHALLRRREAVAARLDIEERLDDCRDIMQESHERVDDWSLDDEGFAALRGGLKKTFKRARDAMAHAYAEPSVERFHEWRKRVKYHRYHTRLLRDIWPVIMRRRRNETNRLSDRLGDDHDLAVLRATLTGETDRFGEPHDQQALLALIDRRRKELQAWSHPLGVRLFAEKPKRYADRLARVWQAWRAERQLTQVMEPESREVFS